MRNLRNSISILFIFLCGRIVRFEIFCLFILFISIFLIPIFFNYSILIHLFPSLLGLFIFFILVMIIRLNIDDFWPLFFMFMPILIFLFGLRLVHSILWRFCLFFFCLFIGAAFVLLAIYTSNASHFYGLIIIILNPNIGLCNLSKSSSGPFILAVFWRTWHMLIVEAKRLIVSIETKRLHVETYHPYPWPFCCDLPEDVIWTVDEMIYNPFGKDQTP